jgi:hypothetical protein
MGARSAFAPISAISVVVGGTLCGAAPQPGSAWEARFGLTSPGFQQLFNQLVGQGYRLVDVSGYAVGGQDRYAAIWEQSSGPSWQSRHGLSSSQYQQTFDSLLAQGYRLVQVSGYGLNNTDLYAAIWQRSSGPAWEARHGLTSGQFQQTFDQLVARGYRLVDTSAYTVGGRDLHAGIWEKRNGPAWESRSGLTSDQYQQTFDSLVGQGYRLIDVSGYTINGQDRYAAIWEKSGGPTWESRHGMTGDQYQAEFDKLTQQGYRLVHVSGWSSGNTAHFAAIWQKL